MREISITVGVIEPPRWTSCVDARPTLNRDEVVCRDRLGTEIMRALDCSVESLRLFSVCTAPISVSSSTFLDAYKCHSNNIYTRSGFTLNI
jgi:hypothetical protein